MVTYSCGAGGGCAALVALLGAATEQRHAALVSVTPDQSLDELALQFLKHGATMSVKQMEAKLSAWHNDPATLLDLPTRTGSSRTQMLALGPKARGESFATALADDGGESTLCKKKDLIISKFDELLKKLDGEELSANITMGKVSKEYKEAMTSWLDSESTYRLTVEKAKEATEGATFARNEYEKWHDANKTAKKDLEHTLARHEKDREGLADERKLIRMIMRLIGVLHDVQATDKSVAAGGVDSVKDENGVSDPYATKMDKTRRELKANLQRLHALALKTNLPGATQKLALINQRLAVYSETSEVAKILMEMLDDIEQRLKIIDTVDEQAKKLVEDTEAKMVHWEQQLVALSNAADKSKEKQSEAQLQREKLNGNKKVANAEYDDEKAAYTLMIPPYEKEIYVITMIKIKINEHCEQAAASAGGAAA